MISHGPTQTREEMFQVLCAWCEKEGRETVLNWIRVKGSHGICGGHKREVLKEAERLRRIRPVCVQRTGRQD